MKTIKFLLVAIIATTFFSCQNVQESEEYIKLKNEKDSLAQLTNVRGDEINNFLEEFNEIQENLNQIKQKENIISVNTANNDNLSAEHKEQIVSDINSIYEMMQANKKKLAELKRKYAKSNKKASQLAKTIELLEQQIEMKNKEIKELNEKLLAMNIEIENLNQNIEELSAENEEKENVISAKDDIINEVYYVIGTKNELLEHNVITKEGGFIGIGKSTKLKGDFNKDYFTKADKRELKKINIFSKKAKIITPVAEGSYSFVGDAGVDYLEIKDADKFWSASKYLVIQVY